MKFSLRSTLLSLLSFILFVPGLSALDVNRFTVTRLDGRALFRPSGQADWLPVKEGNELKPGDRVKALDTSRVELTSDLGDVIVIDEKGELTLDRSTDEEGALSLFIGRFMFNVLHKPNRKFKVKTPLAAVAIRGTEFAVVQTAEDAWEGGVIEGQVAVSALDETTGAETDEIAVATEQGFRTARGQKPARLVGLPPRVALLRPHFKQIRQRALDARRDLRRDLRRKRLDLRKKLRPPEGQRP
ncbi:MAG: FecR domain-containing protein [Elusimicrobia bacterium]|nr:FecR domain-containing protein [Elusimicrobiota bacterium]